MGHGGNLKVREKDDEESSRSYEAMVSTEKKKKFVDILEKLTQYAITRDNSVSKCYDD